ncbi:hypothetical protein ANO11243_091070 [Dothideomycetidae sp. 11243]|nr:hypothetical protein ANO11243_091070 [fungal sp. No.11243]
MVFPGVQDGATGDRPPQTVPILPLVQGRTCPGPFRDHASSSCTYYVTIGARSWEVHRHHQSSRPRAATWRDLAELARSFFKHPEISWTIESHQSTHEHKNQALEYVETSSGRQNPELAEGNNAESDLSNLSEDESSEKECDELGDLCGCEQDGCECSLGDMLEDFEKNDTSGAGEELESDDESDAQYHKLPRRSLEESESCTTQQTNNEGKGRRVQKDDTPPYNGSDGSSSGTRQDAARTVKEHVESDTMNYHQESDETVDRTGTQHAASNKSNSLDPISGAQESRAKPKTTLLHESSSTPAETGQVKDTKVCNPNDEHTDIGPAGSTTTAEEDSVAVISAVTSFNRKYTFKRLRMGHRLALSVPKPAIASASCPTLTPSPVGPSTSSSSPSSRSLGNGGSLPVIPSSQDNCAITSPSEQSEVDLGFDGMKNDASFPLVDCGREALLESSSSIMTDGAIENFRQDYSQESTPRDIWNWTSVQMGHQQYPNVTVKVASEVMLSSSTDPRLAMSYVAQSMLSSGSIPTPDLGQFRQVNHDMQVNASVNPTTDPAYFANDVGLSKNPVETYVDYPLTQQHYLQHDASLMAQSPLVSPNMEVPIADIEDVRQFHMSATQPIVPQDLSCAYSTGTDGVQLPSDMTRISFAESGDTESYTATSTSVVPFLEQSESKGGPKRPPGLFKKVPFAAPLADRLAAALQILLKCSEDGHGLTNAERKSILVSVRDGLDSAGAVGHSDAWSADTWAAYLSRSGSGERKATVARLLCILGYHQSKPRVNDDKFGTESLYLSADERRKVQYRLSKTDAQGERLLRLVERFGLGIMLSPYVR